jgi:pimeloyl-ACP methyl ester carboxylesterase
MIREGSGEPVVLLHGVLGSERMWSRIVPLLAPDHDVIVPTALGHVGGRVPQTRPVGVQDMIDDAERTLDELGLDTAHLVGNSMGGWLALELARRGRARSVCALSPGGCWEPGPDVAVRSRVVGRLRRTMVEAKRFRRIMPLGMPLPQVRAYALRGIAAHGERATGAEVIGLTDDMLGCTVADDLFVATDGIAPLDPLPCPVTIAWCAEDRILPMRSAMAGARVVVPQAEFLVIPDVGHVPMTDAPEVVAGLIRKSVVGAGRAA